jgi:hypothetical protein
VALHIVRSMLAIASASAPALWLTLVTAFGGVLIGGAITAGVESRRARHERMLEQQRDASDNARRAALEEKLAKGAARQLSDELFTAKYSFGAWVGAKTVWPGHLLQLSTLPEQDGRTLAEHLTEQQWREVAIARQQAEMLKAVVAGMALDRPWFTLDESSPNDRLLLAGLRGASKTLGRAIAVLGELSGDAELTEIRLADATIAEQMTDPAA